MHRNNVRNKNQKYLKLTKHFPNIKLENCDLKSKTNLIPRFACYDKINTHMCKMIEIYPYFPFIFILINPYFHFYPYFVTILSCQIKNIKHYLNVSMSHLTASQHLSNIEIRLDGNIQINLLRFHFLNLSIIP